MIKLKEILTEAEVSRELWYHINHNISLEECVFRYGSPKYFTIINEARLLQCEQNIDFDNQTRALLETDLGKFATYKGEEVALDFPMINEAYSGFMRNPEDPDSEPFGPTGSVSGFREELRALFGKFKGDLKNPEFIKGVAQIMVNWKPLLRSQLDENKKKKKDPPIGKPKRGGSKAYYVYVRDPKTKRIKKVTFGSGGLKAKIRNPKARNAFSKRHDCPNKKDRMKASYWSCNLPRYAPALGLGPKMNTFW